MKLTDLVDDGPKTITLIVLTGLLFWAWGCPATTPSLIEPGRNVTRPELQIELNSIVATAEFRMADLDRQDQMRDIIFQNALLIVDGGTLNPAGVLSGMAALYGLLTGANQIKKKIAKKKNDSA